METAPKSLAPGRWLLLLGGLLVVIELAPNLFGSYGIFIDEYYYVACSERLALGYVDHPPLSVWLLRASRAVLGDSQLALRVLPALAGGASVVLTGLLARRLGAGVFGQVLAGLALAMAPIPLIFFGIYTMNAFEVVLWAAACLVLVEEARTGDRRWWLVFGCVAGVGLMNKHTFVLLAAGLLVGLLLTPARRELASRQLWLGVAIAALILSPNLVWQAQHGWPSLEFYHNADVLKSAHTPALEVLLQQVLFMNPIGAVLWIAGIVFFLATERGRPYRHLGWLFVALLVLIVASQRSRPDRIQAAYPIVFAGGAVLLETLTARASRRWVRWALPILLVACTAVFAPISLPILPPEKLGAYAASLGVVPQIERGEGKVSELPQWMADRFEWRELAEEIEEVVAAELAPGEHDRALVLVPSYGHAGALEYHAPDLPRVAGTQNTYFLWGPGEGPIDVVVAVGYGQTLAELFADVRQVGTSNCRWCPAWRDGLGIYVARRPNQPFQDAWERFKHYE